MTAHPPERHVLFPPTVTVDRTLMVPAAGVSYEPTSGYVEMFWLPILGPSSILAGRRLFTRTVKLGRYDQDLGRLALELGLQRGLARSAPMVRTLNRLIQFGVAAWDEPSSTFTVESAWPVIRGSRLDRLPPHLARHATPRRPPIPALY